MNTGVMLAFTPGAQVAAWLEHVALKAALSNVTSANEMHMTLVILGDAAEIAAQKDAITNVVRAYAATQVPLTGSISGVGRFNQTHLTGMNCIYASVDAPGLPAFRDGLLDVLQNAGVQIELEHGFTPHITLAYVPETVPTPDITLEPVLLGFTDVLLAWGDEKMTLPLLGESQPVTVSETETTSADTEYVTGSAIKALDGDRVGGYLAVWGSPTQRDQQGEWFSPRTDFALNWYGKSMVRPALFHHAGDRNIGGVAIGQIDTLRPDDKGLWAEAELDNTNAYYKPVKQMVADKKVFWSSGTLPRAPRKTTDGEILYWPLVEGSLTPSPVELRNTDVYFVAPATAMATYKALNLPTDFLMQIESATGSAQDGGGGTTVLPMDRVVKGAIDDFDTLTTVNEPDIVCEDDMAETIPDVQALVNESVASAIKGAIPSIVTQLQAAMTPVPTTPVATPVVVPSTPTKSLPVPAPVNETKIEIIRATKFSDLTAAEMSFFGMVAPYVKATMGSVQTDSFVRELADKTLREVARGTLPASAAKALVQMGIDTFQKANELNYSTQASYGDEWVPDSWLANLWLKTRQDNTIFPLFNAVEMPTNPFEIPNESTDPTVYNFTELTAQTSLALTAGNLSKFGSGKVQLSAGKIGFRAVWSAEMGEDSVIAVVPSYARQGIRTMENAVDNVLMNGDTVLTASTNINLIDGTPSATDKYTVFDGIRKYCILTNTAQKKSAAGTPTLALMRQTRNLLGTGARMNPRQCAWLVDDSTYIALLNMPEFLTMDKAGIYATNLTGQIGVIDGVPVFGSAEMALSDSAGKIPTAGGTLGQAVIVFRPNWTVGFIRKPKTEVEKVVGVDAFVMSVYARLALGSMDTTSAALLYNITV